MDTKLKYSIFDINVKRRRMERERERVEAGAVLTLWLLAATNAPV